MTCSPFSRDVMMICFYLKIVLATISLFLLPHMAVAAVPSEWGLGFQESATPVMERLTEFHNFLLYIITGITVFVLALLIYVVIRFREKANPVPSKTTHNVPLEIIWTVVPVVILILIVVPSMKLLYYTDRVVHPDMTLKVTGYQWYWGYEYPDQGGVNFLSNRIADKDLDKAKGDIRLLSTDNPVVIPIDTNIQVLVTAADVIHSFAVPSFGIKKDAVPGRLNETWIRATKLGTYYGQCSELCGKDHGYMPIEFKVVTRPEFDAWIANQKKAQGIADATPTVAPISQTVPANTTSH